MSFSLISNWVGCTVLRLGSPQAYFCPVGKRLFWCRGQRHGADWGVEACLLHLLQVILPLAVFIPSYSCQGEKKGMSACFFWGFPAQKIYCSLRLAPTNCWILLLCPFAFHSWSCSHFKALEKTYWHCRKGDKLASWAALTTKLPDFVMVFFLNWCQKLKDKFA